MRENMCALVKWNSILTVMIVSSLQRFVCYSMITVSSLRFDKSVFRLLGGNAPFLYTLLFRLRRVEIVGQLVENVTPVQKLFLKKSLAKKYLLFLVPVILQPKLSSDKAVVAGAASSE